MMETAVQEASLGAGPTSLERPASGSGRRQSGSKTLAESGRAKVDILDPRQELEVIKAVLLRESYLVRLRQLHAVTKDKAEKVGTSRPMHSCALLVSIRMSSR
jgi:hypothetical protein